MTNAITVDSMKIYFFCSWKWSHAAKPLGTFALLFDITQCRLTKQHFQIFVAIRSGFGETVLRYSWDQELHLCQILSFKKNFSYLKVQMTSGKFEFLVSGELLFDF